MMNKIIKRISIFLGMIVVSICVLSNVYGFSPSEDTLYDGIDVSSWQGNINYTQVKNAGIDIVYIKSSEGTYYVDSYFKRNYQNAKANGLKVGFYHFVVARTVDQAKAEARFFVNTIAGTTPDCKLAMDFEDFGNLGATQVTQIAKAFLQEVKALSGLDVVIYSNTYSARTMFGAELSNYPLWVAQYGVQRPGSNGKWAYWVGWQYADNGRISGINGNVDKNYFTSGILLSNTSPIPPSGGTQQPSQSTVYIVKSGDTLSGIAAKYGTTVANLVSLNQISNPNLIYPGQRIIISGGSSGGGNSGGTQTVYVVKSGDTLSGIASRYGTTTANLARINNIANPNLIYPGQRIVINGGSVGGNTGTSQTVYTVRAGDTLSGIAFKYGTTTANLARINNIANPNLIYPGQRIMITNMNTRNMVIHDSNHIIYTVKAGDTLSGIAARYNVTLECIAGMNDISNPNLIYPGQRLRICNH